MNDYFKNTYSLQRSWFHKPVSLLLWVYAQIQGPRKSHLCRSPEAHFGGGATVGSMCLRMCTYAHRPHKCYDHSPRKARVKLKVATHSQMRCVRRRLKCPYPPQRCYSRNSPKYLRFLKNPYLLLTTYILLVYLIYL